MPILRDRDDIKNVRMPLDKGWSLARLPAGFCADPNDLKMSSFEWRDAVVPGTVAMSVHADIDLPGAYDTDDWWYRLTFAAPPYAPNSRLVLCMDGLATLAEVWLNGAPVLSSQNMFIGHRIDVSHLLLAQNQLIISFRSISHAAKVTRSRPRWKTSLVDVQNLRWFRTTLLGRIPGWTPPIEPVGPWAAIGLEIAAAISVDSVTIQSHVLAGNGRFIICAIVNLPALSRLGQARLILDNNTYPLDCTQTAITTVSGDLTIPAVPVWWPHTHGAATLLAWSLEIDVDGVSYTLQRGKIGFKQIRADQSDSKVRFVVNDLPVFCRGACWITNDFISLRGDPGKLREKLFLAKTAGLNMLRVSGTSAYESDEFYSLCDELGILVWQDFMFANMDYPVADAAFRANIEAEVHYQLGRLSQHVCVAVYCGGSEIQQQASMLGLACEQWESEFFDSTLEQFCSASHANVPYFPSSPFGGALPFHVGAGIAHYYGVGAYKRPIADVKSARVKFAAECLGFANVPDPETMDLMLNGKTPPPHHPRWKSRAPRDNGAGWDFDDIRDHYLQSLFGLDPIALRSQNLERYYAISRVVSGEVMQRVFSEWRNPVNHCGGALVWFFADLWPGAGWGIVDSTGRPKAAYWFLKRAWAQQALRFTDEGLDGLNIHLINERNIPLDAAVEFDLLREGRSISASSKTTVHVPAQSSITIQADALLGHFADSNWAYRFGPPKHDVITARLIRDADGTILSEDFFFPMGLNLPMQRAQVVEASSEWLTRYTVAVTLLSDVFLQSVNIDCRGFSPDDNYFHLAPNQKKRIIFTATDVSTRKFRVIFGALNTLETIDIRAVMHEELFDGQS